MAELWVLDAKDFAAGASRLVQDALSRTGELTLSLDSEATLKLVARVGEISAETFHKLVQGLVHQLIQKLPTLESDIYYVINVIFTPRAILQQIVAATVLQVRVIARLEGNFRGDVGCGTSELFERTGRPAVLGAVLRPGSSSAQPL
eukprot:scaffold53_cov193-Pinguiococcus_pyrenoidosus.AAC.54